MTLKIDLNKELEKKFRMLAMKRYGYSKGAIKKAAEHAIENWIREAIVEAPVGKIRDPIKLIEGGLSHLRGKFTSVELQHEAMQLWAEREVSYKKK